MNNTQRIEELASAVKKLEQQAAQADGVIDRLVEDVRKLDPLLLNWSKTQDRLDKLERAGDQWATRAWGIGEKLLIAAVAAAFGYYLKR